MQRVFEKIIEKLKEKKTHETFCDKEVGFNKGIRVSIEIVNQIAKEYVPEINVGNINYWIPVSERLPEESLESVIGWDYYRERCVFVQYYGGRWRLPNNSIESVIITAWQPMPQAYKEKECNCGQKLDWSEADE